MQTGMPKHPQTKRADLHPEAGPRFHLTILLSERQDRELASEAGRKGGQASGNTRGNQE